MRAPAADPERGNGLAGSIQRAREVIEDALVPAKMVEHVCWEQASPRGARD